MNWMLDAGCWRGDSNSANIVEGYGRRSYKADFIRFLIYAQSSCDETTEWLLYVRDCHPELDLQSTALLNQADELGRKLNKFTQAVLEKHRSPK